MILDQFGRPLAEIESILAHGSVLQEGHLTYSVAGATGIGLQQDEDDGLEALALEDANWQAAGDAQYGRAGSVLITSGYLANMYRTNPIGRNIIRAYVFFTYGTGFGVTFESDSQQRAFDEWAEEANWERQVRQAIRNAALLGDVFGVTFPLREKIPIPDGGELITRPSLDGGDPPKDSVRFWTAQKIAQIYANPEDVEERWGYKRRAEDAQAIHPEDVVHAYFEMAPDATRGEPVLIPALRDLARAESFAEGRYMMNWLRQRIPLIRKVHGSAGFVAKEAAKPAYANPPKAGKVVFENGAVDWIMPDLNVRAADSRDDFRMIILRIAAAVNLPEYAIIQDASNSNYASTLIAGTPAAEMFGSYKAFWALVLERLLRPIGASRAHGWGDEFAITPSPAVRLDKKEIEEWASKAVADGVMSRRTNAELVGLRWTGPDGELARMQAEATSTPTGGLLAPRVASQPDETDEEGAIEDHAPELELDQNARALDLILESYATIREAEIEDTAIASLKLAKSRFPTRASAAAWVRAMNERSVRQKFQADDVDETPEMWVFQQIDAASFSSTLVAFSVVDGVTAFAGELAHPVRNGRP